MNINTKATHFELTPAISDYLLKKLETLDRMVSADEANAIVDVEIGKTTNHHKSGIFSETEINCYIEGTMLRAVSVKDDLYAAIDGAKDKLSEEISKYKNRNRSLLRRGSQRIKNIAKGIIKGRYEKDI